MDWVDWRFVAGVWGLISSWQFVVGAWMGLLGGFGWAGGIRDFLNRIHRRSEPRCSHEDYDPFCPYCLDPPWGPQTDESSYHTWHQRQGWPVLGHSCTVCKLQSIAFCDRT